jgi:hypothetical protein
MASNVDDSLMKTLAGCTVLLYMIANEKKFLNEFCHLVLMSDAMGMMDFVVHFCSSFIWAAVL